MIDLRSSYTSAEFADVIAREDDRVELKSGVRGKALQEALVALSNAAGGVIFLGVNDDRTLRRVDLAQGVEDSIRDAAHEAHDVGRIEIRSLRVGRTPLVAVVVHARHEGFAQTSDGRVLVRQGARNRALIGSDLAHWLSTRAAYRYEATATTLRVTDADPDALSEVCARHGWDPQDPHLPGHLRDRLLATPDGFLTIAGALALTDPTRSLADPKYVIDVRGYENEHAATYVRRDVITGPVFDQVRRALALILRDLGEDNVVLRVYRHELQRLPAAAVREVLANAVAHRSYEASGTAVVVEIRPHRVVVRSPGPLPSGVTVARLRQAQKARNPALIDVLRRFDLAEDSGRGIDLIEDEMRAAFLRNPTFEDDGESVTVTLPRDAYLTPRERAWIEELERDGTLAGPERALLVTAARGETLTNARARTITQVDSTDARRALRRLRDRGLLIQHGSRGGATYTLGNVEPPPSAVPPPDPEEVVLASAATRRVTNALVRETTGLDRAVAGALLRRLVDEGRLVQHGQRRGTYYTLPGGPS
ncbi:MAG: ATP-binding protein [Actinomycetes bacterium]